jgi:Domain of unknown function (DUF4169)
MGDLINLRRIRKRRAKDEAERMAEANRLAFGALKDERRRREMEQALAQRELEGRRLEGPRDDHD